MTPPPCSPMRLAFLALLLAAAGCDSPADDAGSFSLAFSGARTATISGDAGFALSPCRAPVLSAGATSVFLNPPCTQAADGTYSDGVRRGTFDVSADRRAGTFAVSFYDSATQGTYRATSGTVTVTGESRERLEGRIDVEARPVDADNQVDPSAAPLRIAGTFEAVGYVGID